MKDHDNCKGCYITDRSHCNVYVYNVYGDCPCTNCLVKVTCDDGTCQKLTNAIIIIIEYGKRKSYAYDEVLKLLRGNNENG